MDEESWSNEARRDLNVTLVNDQPETLRQAIARVAEGGQVS
jgi:hypothetical protein